MATEEKRMRQLSATEAEWQASNPVLLDGEIAFSRDVEKYKVGDGVSNWASLGYWEPTVSAPTDGQNYGLKGTGFHPTINYEEGYSGDLNNITPDKVKMVQVEGTITNGWDKITRGDMVLDIHNALDGTRIQVGFNHSSEISAGTVLHSRVLRGTWSEWVTHIAHSEEPFNGDLGAVAEGTADYIMTVGTTTGVTSAWPDITPNSLVMTMNVTGNIAYQIGFEKKTSNPDLGLLWMRKKDGGVWNDWGRISVYEEDIVDLDRIRWRGDYVEGTTYEKNDMVNDWPWLMVANKQTTDRPAPQPSGDQVVSPSPDPTWIEQSHTGLVTYGMQVTFDEGGWVTQIDGWAPEIDPNYDWQAFIIDVTNPSTPQIREITGIVSSEDNWQTIELQDFVVASGTVLQFVVRVINSSSSNQITGDWIRGSNSNSAPASQTWNRATNGTNVKIHQTDLLSADRKTELMTIDAGSVIRFETDGNPDSYVEYQCLGDAQDMTTYVQWEVSQVDVGPDGEPIATATTNMTATVPVPAGTAYDEEVDYWLTNQPDYGTIIGILEHDGTPQTGAADNAYGIRIHFQGAYVSPDFDFAALSGSGGSTGGGGGGATTFTGLTDTPASYAGHTGKVLAVNGAEDGLEFVAGGGGGTTTFLGLTDTPVDYSGSEGYLVMVNSGGTALEFNAETSLPYVKAAGDTMTGALTMAGATQSQTRIFWDNQTNAESWIVDHLDAGGLRLVEVTEAIPYLFQSDGLAGQDAAVLRRSAGDARYLQPTQADGIYLKLDASNGPVTGELIIDKTGAVDNHHLTFIDQFDNVTGWYMNGQLYFETKTGSTFKFDDDRGLSANGSIVSREGGDGRYGRLANFNTWTAGQTIEGNITAKGDYIRLNTSSLAKQVTLDFRVDSGYQQAIRMHDQSGYRNLLAVDASNKVVLGDAGGGSFTGQEITGDWDFLNTPTYNTNDHFLHTGNFRSLYQASGADTAITTGFTQTVKPFATQDTTLTGVSYASGVFTIGSELDGKDANIQFWVSVYNASGTDRSNIELSLQWRVDSLGTWATVAGPFSNYLTRQSTVNRRGSVQSGIYRTTLATDGEFRVVYEANDESGSTVFDTGAACVFEIEVIG